MRKTLFNALIVVLGLAGLVACSADVGERGDTLRAVDEDAMVGQLLYMRPDLTPFPMTAAELEASGTDATLAIPVRVEIFDSFAVAWFAPDGVAQVNRDNIISIWNVVERTPTEGALENNAEVGVVEPGNLPIFVRDPLAASPTLDVPQADLVTAPGPRDSVTSTIMDFYDLLAGQQETAVIAQLSGFHPGCL